MVHSRGLPCKISMDSHSILVSLPFHIPLQVCRSGSASVIVTWKAAESPAMRRGATAANRTSSSRMLFAVRNLGAAEIDNAVEVQLPRQDAIPPAWAPADCTAIDNTTPCFTTPLYSAMTLLSRDDGAWCSFNTGFTARLPRRSVSTQIRDTSIRSLIENSLSSGWLYQAIRVKN